MTSQSSVGRVLRTPAAQVSVLLLIAVAALVVAGSWFTPYDPVKNQPEVMLQGPSGTHWLGTDYLGRDVLSRLMAGARVSVLGAVLAVAIALGVGVPAGLGSAWLGRRFEWVTLRITDTLMVLPFTVFAIAVVGTLGNGLTQSMLAIGVLMIPLFFRVTRAVALGLRQTQYVEAAELMGASQWWVVRKHIWSKVVPTVAVTTAQALGAALLVMASLTFLGLGVPPPAPTWGGMLASDLAYLSQQPWAPLYPGLLIMITVGALNLLADVIRETSPESVRRGWRRNLAAAAGAGLVGGASAVDPVDPVGAAASEPVPSTNEKEDADVRAARVSAA